LIQVLFTTVSYLVGTSIFSNIKTIKTSY